MIKKIVYIALLAQMLLLCNNLNAQTISPLVGEAIRAFRSNEFETAREKADKAILSGNYSMNQRRDLYYIRGYGLFLVSNYPEALKDFDMVLDIKMNDKQSQLLKAECYYYMNKFEPAIEEFNNAEKLWKSTDDNYNNMAAYIKAMRGKCQYKLAKYDIAFTELNKSLALDSTVMDIWETFGDINFTLKNYDTSLYFYSRAIELYKKNNDNSIYGWIWRGKVYDSLKNQDAAISNFKEAIKIKSFEREPYWLAALSYEKKKNVDSSLMYFQEALARTDSMDEGSLKLLNHEIGMMYKKNNNFDEAIKYFQKALVIDDHYKESYAAMADCYVEIKQYKQSIEPYERAIIVYQQDKKDSLILSSLYLKLGDVYIKTKDESKAKDNYLSALKWNKGNNSASMNQANVLYANKKYKEAIPFFKKVIENPVPSEPVVMQEALYKQGMCYLDLKDTSSAMTSLQKSMEYKTTHDEAQVKLSEIYFAKKQFDKVGGLLGNLDSSLKKFDTTALTEMYYKKGVSGLMAGNAVEAKNDFTKCIQYSGNNKKAYRGLGDATMQTKEYSEAEAAYTHCIDLYKNEKDSLYKMYLYRAQAKSKQNNFAEAVGDIEAAGRIKSNNNITKSLIETNIAAGYYDKALNLIALFQKSLKTSDLSALSTCYYYRAQCNVGSGNSDKALNDLAKAISYNRNYPEAQKLLNDLNGNPNSLPSTTASTTNNNGAVNAGSNSSSAVAPPVSVSPTVAATPVVASGSKSSKKDKKAKKETKASTEPVVTEVAAVKIDTAMGESNKESVVAKPVSSKKDKNKKKTAPAVQDPVPSTAAAVPNTEVVVPPVTAPTEAVKNDGVVAPSAQVTPKEEPVVPKVEPIVEVKKDTVVTPPAPVVPKVEPIVEVKKDTVVTPPAPVVPKVEPIVEVKKDTAVTPLAQVMPKVEPVVEVKKDTVVTPPAPVVPKVEPVVEVKMDTVVTPPAPIIPKVESVVEVKKDTVVTAPAPVVPKVEPIVEVKKDTVVTPPAPIVPKVEPVVEVKKDTVVTPPAPIVPKVEPVVEVKKDTVVTPPAPIVSKVEPIVEVKKDTVITPPAPIVPKVEPVVEVKKDTVVTPPAPIFPKVEPVVEVKKDTVVTPPAPIIPKVELVVEVKKDTVVTPPAPVVPKVEPVVESKKDTTIVPVPVVPKVDSAKTETIKDTSTQKEIKKDNTDHLQADERDELNNDVNMKPLKPEAKRED